MYRLTFEPKYREWGWKIFEAITKLYNYKSLAYESISDTTASVANANGMLPGSYFLSETLKVQ